jgi:hypothetical protein
LKLSGCAKGLIMTAENPVKAMAEAVNAFFQEEDWTVNQPDTEEPSWSTGFQGENGQWMCYAEIRADKQQFIFYSICPTNAPEAKKLAMAEFLTRANYGLIMGNFEMDFSDGEIRYKTSLDVENDRLSPALVKNVVYANVSLMDTYLPGIMKLIYSDAAPVDLIDELETSF